MSGQVVGSRVRQLRGLMHLYGPMHKALGALDSAKQESLAADPIAPAERFNRATDGTLVAPSEYFEVVIKCK